MIHRARRARAGWLLLLAAACGEPEGTVPSLADTLTRERAVATFVADSKRASDAVEQLRPLVERPDAATSDLVLSASLALQAYDLELARELLARVPRGSAGEPAVQYLLARIAALDGDDGAELAHLRAAHDAAPGDVPTQLLLGAALATGGDADAGAPAEREEARALLEGVLGLGPDNGLAWYASAVYQLLRLASRADDAEAIRRYSDLHASLERRGLKVAGPDVLNQGWLARIAPPKPRGSSIAAPPHAPEYALEAAVLPELANARELAIRDLDGDHRPDFVACGPGGLYVTRRGASGYEALRVQAGDVRLARLFDVDDTGDTLDLLFVEDRTLRLFEQNDGAWHASDLALPTFPAPPADMVLVDFDHDGDLDLLVVGPFGARLLRNDGAARLTDGAGNELPRGRFVEVGAEAGLPAEGAFTWCATEDFDGDQDVDLLLGGPERLFLASNLRGGKFEDRTSAVFGDARIPRRPLLADFDGDARTDLFAPGAGGAPATLWMQAESGHLVARATQLVVPPGADVVGVDCDLDGALDVLWPADGAVAEGALALGQPFQTPVRLGPDAGAGPLAAGDLDLGTPNTIELARAGADGARIARVTSAVGGGARFKLAGRKDNQEAVGAILEARAGPIYRRVYWRGPAVVVGVGGEERIDVVRITWPNGVVQSMLDVPLGDHFPPRAEGLAFEFDTTGATTPGVAQEEGLAGSCPFLYTWNGATFEFVTDVLGVTPLGLPMAPGMLVPPDHDEYVLVRGDQLAARDGMLELQITEELREVTYLDRIRLDAVDHPAGTEIHPNERFQLPPFPEPRIHVARTILPPARATDDEGRDWTSALARVDGVHAVPFRPLPPQFQGLAGPHRLELAFDREAVAGARTLRLLCTGWFRWSDASVNMAAARTPGADFVPPVIEVPDGAGGWTPTGPPVGFPAGKTKTMVVDVTDLLARDDPRLRLFSTLQLYWDSIRLAVDGDEEEVRVTPLEPASASLAWRGFSAPLAAARPDQPERFVWDELAPEPRWDQHPGLYTRYGETLPLVTAIDDRFVILGAGDALHVRFDARALLPVPAGFVRDYLVFLDGWAKDRDPNTLDALAVEPLPFHGMSGYPYGPDERFPDDAGHARWRREWNTREAYRAIVPLSPVRESAWALGR